MYPKLLSIGNITIYTYGLFVALGVLAGFNMALKLAGYRSLTKNFMNYLMTGGVIAGIIGARIAYILIAFENYTGDILRVFMFWEGGLVFWGGLIGGAVWVMYACSKWSINIGGVSDVLAPALAFGHTIGRIGCFFAGCCYGRQTDSWLGVSFTHPESLAMPLGIALHPTQLYESFLLFILSGVLYVKLKSPKSKPAAVFGVYLLFYGVIRIVVEYFRGDFRGGLMVGITPTQWIAVLGILLGSFLIFKPKRLQN